MPRPRPQTDLEWRRQVARDVQILGRRGRTRLPQPDRGTVAERTTKYPNPTNLAERVALANQQVAWFNTEQQWWESYYTTTGEAGLTVRGLRAGVATGWYPMPGSGPRRRLRGSGSQSMGPGSSYANWASTGADTVNLGSGSMQITLPNAYSMRVPIAGDYDMIWRLGTQSGNGVAILNLWRYTAPVGAIVAEPIPLVVAASPAVFHGIGLIQAAVNAEYGLVVSSGELFVGGTVLSAAQFEIRYATPPFAS